MFFGKGMCKFDQFIFIAWGGGGGGGREREREIQCTTLLVHFLLVSFSDVIIFRIIVYIRLPIIRQVQPLCSTV